MAGDSRVALVLGAGGIAGGAWHSGALAALHDATGWDPRDATIVVGTSAGSIEAATLRAGLSAADSFARAEARPVSPAGARLLARAGPAVRTPTERPDRRRQAPSVIAATLARAAARPFRARPTALLAALWPEGTLDTDFIARAVDGLAGEGWPDRTLWICAVRQRDGRRVVFGHDAHGMRVSDAVAASCAIPGFFRPVEIDGDTYIDGGAHSPTNADVLLHASPEVDLVLVSSPMSLAGRTRRLRADQPARRLSRALLDGEAVRLRRRGVHVVALQPTADDAAVMGLNAMDPSRRAAIARQAYESTLRRFERADTRDRVAAIIR
jgi:NTE family protein